MHSALALVLAATLALDGGVAELYSACPDAPVAVQVDGGWFMPEARWNRINCRLAACETWVEGKRGEEVVVAPGPAAWVGIAVSIIGTVATAVVAVMEMKKGPQPAP